MSIPIKPFTFSNGTSADAIEVNADYDALYSWAAGNVESDNIKSASIYDSDINWGTGSNQISAVDLPVADAGSFFTGTNTETALQEIGAGMVPVGSIIPFYDLGGLCTFTAANWEYCNGAAVVSATSPIVGQTKPDLSGRYLVGFSAAGTEGGGDIGTEPWATPAVGNTTHQVNLTHTHTISHNHTLSAHTHAGPSHSHTGPSHTHTTDIASFTSGAGTAHDHSGPSHTHSFSDSFSISSSGNHIHSSDAGASGGWIESSSPGRYTDAADGDHTHTGSVSGTTGAGGTGNTGTENAHTHAVNPPSTTSAAAGTGATGPSGTDATGVPSTDQTGTDATASTSALSATQSIQPRSIRVRYIMRVL